MMRTTLKYLLLMFTPVLLLPVQAENSIRVVANTEGKELTLGREQVRNLFMGASLGYDLRPVALPPKNRTRMIFNTQIIGLTESRIQSYWAQMKFTGRMQPPREINDEPALLDYLVAHPGSVGYLPADVAIPNALTVLYEVR